MHRIINWNELWKAIFSASPSNVEKECSPGAAWDRRAAAYDQYIHEEGEEAREEMELMDLRPGDTVLDMGAGTGRLAVPMAKLVSQVTALDVSEGMLSYLRKNMADAGLSNYSCIRMRWEDVQVGKDVKPHSVVVAASSLGFYDIKMALEKIDAAATRAVYLSWFAGEWRSPEELLLWNAVFGPMRGGHPGFPDYIHIANILHDMDIFANIDIYEVTGMSGGYATADDAARQWIRMHEAPEDSIDIVTNHFRRVLVPSEDGRLLNIRRSKRAMIWWLKE
jgi:SAM-dependent methyltransferase